jgi:tripartite-type tricarboxylate transporter receptor subunit TctC
MIVLKDRDRTFSRAPASALLCRMAAVIVLALVCSAGAVRADDAWPSRQINLLVPYPPGGYIDLVARIVADGLHERFRQNAIVFNRAGGNGQVALGDLSRAAPDGYTLLTNNDGGIGLPPALDRNFRFTPVKDYAPLAQVVEAKYVLVVRAGLPIKTVADLVAYAKSSPKPLTFASPGTGSTPHIGMEFFSRKVGIKMIHVPYSGSAAAINDLIGGQVDVYLASIPTIIGQVGGDRLRALAVLGDNHANELPSVPTLDEAGFPGLGITGWLGLFGPPAMPDALRVRVSDAFESVVHDPKIAAKLKSVSADPVTKGSAEFGPFYLSEVARWKAFSDETNIKAGD